MWFFKKIVDVYYIILFEWFELFFVSGIFNRMVIILIYLLQKKKKWKYVASWTDKKATSKTEHTYLKEKTCSIFSRIHF